MTPYEKIYLLQLLIGHEVHHPTSDEFFDAVSYQAGLVLEEAQEALDEAIDRDLEKLTKEVADVMVTSIGLLQKLQRSGVPVDEVLDRICSANLDKFHRDADHANETVKFYQDQGIETFVRLVTLEDGSEYYGVIRKEDNKLMKPHDFVGADTEGLFDDCVKPWEEEGDSNSQ